MTPEHQRNEVIETTQPRGKILFYPFARIGNLVTRGIHHLGSLESDNVERHQYRDTWLRRAIGLGAVAYVGAVPFVLKGTVAEKLERDEMSNIECLTEHKSHIVDIVSAEHVAAELCGYDLPTDNDTFSIDLNSIMDVIDFDSEQVVADEPTSAD